MNKRCPENLLPVRERALNDYLFFRTKILGRKHLAGNKFQEDMARFSSTFSKKRVKLRRVPRGHGKTTDNVDQMLWFISKDPNERILFCGPTEDHAESVLAEVKTIASTNRMLQRLFPDVWPDDPKNDCPIWVRDRIQVNRDEVNKNPTILTAGLESSNTGAHWTKIFLDDQVNGENFKSKVMRDMVWDRTLACRALLDDKPEKQAYLIYSNTPWHHSDATMRLTSSECPFADDVELFERTVYLGNGTDPTAGVIWPEVRSEEFIAAQRQAGMRFFSPHYLMRPMAEGEHPFDVTRLRYFDLRFNIDEAGRATWAHPEGLEFYIHMAVDTNNNANTAADPVAIHVWAKDSMRRMWGLYKRRMKACTTPQLHEAIYQTYQMWQPQSIQYEVRGMDDRSYYELMQHGLRRGVSYPINRLTRGGGRGKGSKYGRIVPMSAAVHEGWFFVPSDPAWREFVEEMEMFDEKCEHDDQMDCVADIYTHGRWPVMPDVPEKEEAPPISANLMKVFFEPTKVSDDRRLIVSGDARIYV